MVGGGTWSEGEDYLHLGEMKHDAGNDLALVRLFLPVRPKVYCTRRNGLLDAGGEQKNEPGNGQTCGCSSPGGMVFWLQETSEKKPEIVGPRYGSPSPYTMGCTGGRSVGLARLFGIETDVYGETIQVQKNS